jgi:enoyl-CoA hydratase
MALTFKVENKIARVGLNRPDALNALDVTTLLQLSEAWDEIAQSDAIRVAVLYSDLPDIFCSGMDLKSVIPILTGMRKPESEDEKVLAQNPVRAYAAMLRGRTWDKPIVSAVHGLCLTGGFEMVMGTDLRIASEDAEFWMREASFGIMPTGGSNAYLPREIPLAAAKEILLIAEPVPARRLYDWGFINRLVAKDSLMDAAMEMAERIAGNGPLAVSGILKCIRETMNTDIETAMNKELEIGMPIFVSADAREGVRAFKEKRKADFKGK